MSFFEKMPKLFRIWFISNMEPLALYKLRLVSASMKTFIETEVIPNIYLRLNQIKQIIDSLNSSNCENNLTATIVNTRKIYGEYPLGLWFNITSKSRHTYSHRWHIENIDSIEDIISIRNFGCKHRYSMNEHDDLNESKGVGSSNYSKLDIQCYYCMLKNKKQKMTVHGLIISAFVELRLKVKNASK